MVKILKGYDEYTVRLSQAELNTISLLLGDYNGDDYIRDIGEDLKTTHMSRITRITTI